MKTNHINHTVLRTSQCDNYMKKFKPKGFCQCHAIDARSIKPIRSDFSLLKFLKILRKMIKEIVFMGIFSTIIMDIGEETVKALFPIKESMAPQYLGRWILNRFNGEFIHKIL